MGRGPGRVELHNRPPMWPVFAATSLVGYFHGYSSNRALLRGHPSDVTGPREQNGNGIDARMNRDAMVPPVSGSVTQPTGEDRATDRPRSALASLRCCAIGWELAPATAMRRLGLGKSVTAQGERWPWFRVCEEEIPVYDAIVVGARCAGSPTAMLLARKGYRVLLVGPSQASRVTLSHRTTSTSRGSPN